MTSEIIECGDDAEIIDDSDDDEIIVADGGQLTGRLKPADVGVSAAQINAEVVIDEDTGELQTRYEFAPSAVDQIDAELPDHWSARRRAETVLDLLASVEPVVSGEPLEEHLSDR